MYHHSPNRGFIALISAIIISVVLLALAVAIGQSTFFARFDALNREYKRLSLGFAESCVTTALGKVAGNYYYKQSFTSDPGYNATRGGVVVPMGTLHGRPAECIITSVATSTEVGGKTTFTISTKGIFNGAYSTITMNAGVQNPGVAPVTPPPTCVLTASPSSVPLGQSVTLLWSASPNATSMNIDHGIGSVDPARTTAPWKTVTPSGTGVVTYGATVSNPGGTDTCETTITVTAPPPAPSCADTVMMLDRSYSMFGYPNYPSGYTQWIPNEKAAGKALVDLYAGVTSLPKIGFGRIADLDDGHGADLVSQLTSNYASVKTAIDSGMPSNPIGYTNLGEAIAVARAELGSARHASDKEKVLIFVSDGIPNEPAGSLPYDTGFRAPTAQSANNSLTGDQWTNPANAYSAGSTTDAGAHRHRYQNFGFTFPANTTIRGIELATNARTIPGGSTTLISENFGSGSSINDIPNWEEEGTESDGSTFASTASSGNDSISPDGGRFAKIGQGEWICRSVNAAGLSSLLLAYYWRGDSDAESSDDLIVEYHPTATNCDTNNGWNQITTQDLNTNTGAWVQRTGVALPTALNNDAAFLLRFRANTNSGNEDTRVDGITLTGTPPACNLGVDLSWNGGNSWTTERVQNLSTNAATYTLGGTTDTWDRTWTSSELSDSNFRARIHATDAGSTCSVDTLTARVSYTVATSPTQYALDAAQSARAAGVSIFTIHFGDTAGLSFLGQLASSSSIPSSAIVSAVRSGGSATIVTSSAHHLTGNQRVQISGTSQSAFNTTVTIVSTPTPTSFTFALSGNNLNATGGTVAPTNLFVSPSSGAMSGIFESIGYQVCPAAAPTCSNTIDDDGDGLVDENDSGCHDDGNVNNPNSYDPSDSDEWETPAVPPAPPPPPPPPNISIDSWLEVP